MKLQNQTQKLVQLGFIYCLKNPKTKDIFYVGATESAPKDRLLGYYYHFKESPFEITDFLDSIFGIENHKKHSGRAGNVSKSLRNGNTIVRTSGYVFKTFDTCDKQIQDIVHKDYESNLTEE